MERIASRHNPVVKRFRDLARLPRSGDAVLLEGEHLVREALQSRIPIELLAVAGTQHAALAAAAAGHGARVIEVSDQVLGAISPVRQPSGVVAIAQCRAATLTECVGQPPQLLLILVGIQDAGNVGAIIRSAEGCGATGVICGDGTADPFGWKALRGAMGSTLRLRVAVRQTLAAITAALDAAGVTIIAAVPRHGTPLRSHDFRGPVAILLGAEGTGLPSDAESLAHARVTIPMQPPVESLNVAITAAIMLYEASSQRNPS